MNRTQIIHVVALSLGGAAVVAAYLNQMQAAGVIAIAITTVNGIGLYLTGGNSQAPASTAAAGGP